MSFDHMTEWSDGMPCIKNDKSLVVIGFIKLAAKKTPLNAWQALHSISYQKLS